MKMSKQSQPIKLPSALSSRKGWADLLEAKRAAQPHLHQIEPTNHCVYACVMCPRKKMTRSVGFMELDLFEKVIEEVATYREPIRSKEIELFHFGESLFHPQLDQMVRIASEKQLKVVLSVNPPQLSKELSERILKGNPYKIIFSLDGPKEQMYQKARGDIADYDRALREIETLIALRDQLGSSTRLVTRMILLKSHESSAATFLEKWEKKGVECELREFFPWGEPEMRELGDYKSYPPFMPCPFPWQYLVVQWNGDIVPCCRDYNATNVLGNARTQTLKEVWNSAAYEAFRDQHRTGHYGSNQTCEKCMSLYYTEINQS
jgi:radical SAM protein with 4Fe4S-binding SPASM domain